MITKKSFAWLLLAAVAVSATQCKKKSSSTPSPTVTPVPSANASKSFQNVTFNDKAAYFSSDGSMTAPVDSNQAKSISSKIDITFIFNFDYTEPGFFDPKARSQVWYWDDYQANWLSNAVETRYYSTTLTKVQFDSAASNQSKIATYFSSVNFVLAPHSIFPTGSCIGGRESNNPTSITLAKDQVFGFKNTATGKRGLLYIRTDQYTGWPLPLTNTNIKVDIIREV